MGGPRFLWFRDYISAGGPSLLAQQAEFKRHGLHLRI
jgi:hypothetical protein